MQALHALQPLFSSLWVLWFFLLFGGILFWVLRPSRRKLWEERGRMVLRDDDDNSGREGRS
ncbi:cbb3-type cytochrome oxidase subunit 3 [Roseococcus sp. DSY-14]|uniref:cbb3-type cytochrome oxidase subunit 3 n=1 Tax=Roseococcus sp. DSY-14 TaxID=3369650 RepID=UPI00387ADB59